MHLPNDEGTPDSDTDKCCTFSVTLINRGRPRYWWWLGWLSWIWSWLWPWFQPYKVRVTAAGGTTILNANPGDWEQVANLPNSVMWDPGTGGPIPMGDAADSWIIDNDFLLSLGQVSSGYKTIKIEWLSASGFVLDAFLVRVPCLMESKEDDFETDWEQYTSVISGGTYVSAYLEPDDCDPGDFDYKMDCTLTPSLISCNASSGTNAYSVTYSVPNTCSSYAWTVDGDVQTGTTHDLTVILAPGDHSVAVIGFDNDGNDIMECGGSLELTHPEPDFIWVVDDCARIAILTSTTGDPNDVVSCVWTCSNSAVPISGDCDTATADFSNVQDDLYDVTLRVKDKYGCYWEKTQTVSVGGCLASWNVNYSWCVDKIDPTAHADISVTFTNKSRGCNPTWLWDFGDSNTSADQNPTHTYQNAANGQVYPVSLTLTSVNPPCTSTVHIPLTLQQRLGPQFTVKPCPSGKVVCETSEPNPVWSASGTHGQMPWPYTKSDKSRIIYIYPVSGDYYVSLTSTNATGNTCTTTQKFEVDIACCTRNTRTSGRSSPISVSVSGHAAQLRVKGKLKQNQGPFWHRVKAKTILQRLNPNGKWRRFKSSNVRLEAMFNGTVYRDEWGPLAFDGSYFTGCLCYQPAATTATTMQTFKKKVRAVDGLGGPFHSRTDSIQSQHGLTIGGSTYAMLNLSLGPPC